MACSANFEVYPRWWTIWSSEWKLVHIKLSAFSSVYISYDLYDHPNFFIWYHKAVHIEAWLIVQFHCSLLYFILLLKLKLDLRTWMHFSTPSLSFQGKPLTYQSNEWAWISVAQKLNLRKHKYYYILYTSNTTNLLCHSVTLSLPLFVLFLKYLCFLSDTCPFIWPYFVSNMNKAASQKLKSKCAFITSYIEFNV